MSDIMDMSDSGIPDADLLKTMKRNYLEFLEYLPDGAYHDSFQSRAESLFQY